jgi:hypothetical protein
VLKTHLDYETRKLYELYLIARDNGYPRPLKTWRKIIINILDENDNSPMCEKSLFIGSIRENQVSRDFLEIRAFDSDSGINGQLQYSILSSGLNTSPLKHELNEQLFEIDRFTGWLSVKKTLDYEKKSLYELKIKVNDSNLKNSFSTYCIARINVIDMNDNPAKMKIIKYLNESVQKGYYSLNTMSESIGTQAEETSLAFFDASFTRNPNQIEFYENNEPYLVLALIRVFDYDATISNYKFQIQSVANSPEDTSMFEIRASDRSQREFELVGLKSFDADTIQNYRLKIILYDLQDMLEEKSNQNESV